MESNESGTGPTKKRYEKPRIVRVLLRPEEAVLGFCKNGNKSGPLRARCNVPTNCSTQGS